MTLPRHSLIDIVQRQIPQPDYNLEAGSGRHSRQTAQLMLTLGLMGSL